MATPVSWESSCSKGCRAVAAGIVGVVVVVCAYGTAAGVDVGATDSAAGAGDALDHLGGKRRMRRRRRRRMRRRRRRTNRKGGGDDDKEDEKSGLGDILW